MYIYYFATGGADANGEHISASGNWNGIVFQGSSGQVYGDVTLEDDLEIPSGSTLKVPQRFHADHPGGRDGHGRYHHGKRRDCQ